LRRLIEKRVAESLSKQQTNPTFIASNQTPPRCALLGTCITKCIGIPGVALSYMYRAQCSERESGLRLPHLGDRKISKMKA
jgi:hypothetical protein